jgi:uncharacterized membrane protein YbhN (UPF0104 family)
MYFDMIGRVLEAAPFGRLGRKALAVWQTFHRNAMVLMTDRAALVFGLGYSFLLQLVVVLHMWLIGFALGFDLPVIDYFVIVPILITVLMLPTINGLGLRDAASILLFGFYGISGTEAVAFSFLDLFFIIILFVAGWVRLVTRR